MKVGIGRLQLYGISAWSPGVYCYGVLAETLFLVLGINYSHFIFFGFFATGFFSSHGSGTGAGEALTANKREALIFLALTGCNIN